MLIAYKICNPYCRVLSLVIMQSNDIVFLILVNFLSKISIYFLVQTTIILFFSNPLVNCE